VFIIHEYKNDLMLSTRFLSLLFVLLLVQVTACRDKADDPEPLSRSQMLTAKTWKMNKVLGNGIDITNQPQVQEYKDMQLSFKEDKTYTIVSTTGTITGTWALEENDTKLVFDPDTATEDTWDILELTADAAQLSSSRALPPTGFNLLLVFELVPA
jgi:hypothetical protein